MSSSSDTLTSTDGLQRLGRYVLLEKVAEGGMAEVFRAAAMGSAGFNKMLAIKRILPHLARDPDFGAMFIDEAKIASQLAHPNVLQVLDLGNQDGQHYIVMEYVAGKPLNKLLAECVIRGKMLPHAMVCSVVGQALTGLSFAHQKRDARGQPLNIIHRDITPHNLMVGYDGGVKLADFGIARAATRTTKTTTGSIKGKPAYMAPEQVVPNHPLDQRLDIYSMGVVLFEMLSLTRLRRGRTDVETLMEVAHGVVPTFEERGAQVPADLAAVSYKALAKDPTQRFQTAEEFRAALSEVARVHGWHWDGAQTQELMGTLFTTDIQAEEAAQEKYVSLIERLGQADEAALARMFSAPAPTAPRTPSGEFDRTVVTGVGPAQANRAPYVAAGVALAVLVGGAGAWLARPTEGMLFVATTPPGASVTVNGQAMPGVTPVALEHLAPGPTVVTVSLEGHVPQERRLDVAAGKQAATLSFALKARPRKVTIQGPAGALISVDNREAVEGPVVVELDPAGTVMLRATLEGFQPLAETRQVSSLADPVVLTLQPLAVKKADPVQAPRGNGTLTLVSKPWARVFIDGKDTGRFTPMDRLVLPAGSHAVTLRNEQQDLTARFRVNVVPDQDVKVTKELR